MNASQFYEKFAAEAEKAIVGQQDAIDLCALAVVVGGHVLLEGVPGVGKTLLAKTVARLLDLRFGRIQFSPDLMPADMVGTAMYDLPTRSFQVREGPVFPDGLLAGELSRGAA